MVQPSDSPREDESPLSEPFWVYESVAEARAVTAVLRRRFPESFAILSASLEEADPFDIVYPDNPGEYDDVVAEIVVLLAPVHGEIRRLPAREIDGVVREGLARRFGELPDSERVRKCVDQILSSLSS